MSVLIPVVSVDREESVAADSFHLLFALRRNQLKQDPPMRFASLTTLTRREYCLPLA